MLTSKVKTRTEIQVFFGPLTGFAVVVVVASRMSFGSFEFADLVSVAE